MTLAGTRKTWETYSAHGQPYNVFFDRLRFKKAIVLFCNEIWLCQKT